MWDDIQLVIVAYEASPALFAAPDVHQGLFLRIIADYTYACFIHVMVSRSDIQNDPCKLS